MDHFDVSEKIIKQFSNCFYPTRDNISKLSNCKFFDKRTNTHTVGDIIHFYDINPNLLIVEYSNNITMIMEKDYVQFRTRNLQQTIKATMNKSSYYKHVKKELVAELIKLL